jgi:hypothetical protein
MQGHVSLGILRHFGKGTLTMAWDVDERELP